jgi:RNA polymerase sigma-70 factor (ECF subfamily)
MLDVRVERTDFFSIKARTGLTDEDLLKLSAAGDRQAFLTIYDRYSPRVLGLLVKLLRDRTEAEDVLQDVMWELWRKADRYNPALGTAAAWILMTARSRAIDAARRAKRWERSRSLARDAASRTDSPPAPPRQDELSRLLDTLPEEQRTAVHLAFVRGFTRAEIAQITGAPIGTVKTRIALAVRRMSEAARATNGGETA